MKKPIFTKTVKRLTIWNAGVMIGLYFIFVIFTLSTLSYVIKDDTDARLKHELQHVLGTFHVEKNKLVLDTPDELNEKDFMYVTEHPFFLQVYNLKGVLYFRSKNLNNYPQILLGFPNKFNPYYFEDLNHNNNRLRIVYKKIYNTDGKHVGYIQLATITSGMNTAIKNILIFNLFALPIFILIILILSTFLAKKSYAPVNKIIALANKISASNLTERLSYDADTSDELGKLKETLNSLFNRLETEINQISHFTDDASHQLMTPLTAIRTELDYILKRERSNEDYINSLHILKEQTDRMITIVKTMLILAKESEVSADSSKVFELSNLISQNIHKYYKNENIQYEIENNLYVRGKQEYFSLVIQNLINNAIKYSEGKKEIKVTAAKINNKIQLTVSDNGIGIPDPEKEKIFNRFYRGSNTEKSKVEGYGLGLSLVYSVTKRMGGKIEIRDNEPKGTVFIITLPTLELN